MAVWLLSAIDKEGLGQISNFTRYRGEQGVDWNRKLSNMAAEENEEESQKDSKHGNAPVKLSHKQFRRLVKKERRRQKRQTAAKKREQEELEEKWRIENDPILKVKLEAKERAEKKRLLEEEEERKTQHRLWLEREAISQEKFRKKREDEERKLREKLEQEERIKKEWEEQQRMEKEKEERKQKAIKEKEDALFRELDKPSTSEKTEAWHNPLAPPASGKSYGTEQDTVNCSFYLKTGACRFGERCSRQHPRPPSSVTLMIPGMYTDIRLSQSMLDEADQDTSLEYDEKEAYENFKQFYEDTLPEFKKAGTVVQFKVCCNHEPHLRGNVYVQFTSEEECARAFALFNARWYALKQLSCEFSPVTKWKSAICGLFDRNRCPRGKNCNFLHVYQNPGNEFNHRDDLLPGCTPHNGWGSERSQRDWRQDRWSRHRDRDQNSSWERDWEQDRHRKHRERSRSRERDDERNRYRRRSKDRKHRRASERREKRAKREHSGDERNESDTDDRSASERLSPSIERSDGTGTGKKDNRHSSESKEMSDNRKHKHRSLDKHSHHRKSKKKHKHRSEHKKKKRHNKSESDSSSSEIDND